MKSFSVLSPSSDFRASRPKARAAVGSTAPSSPALASPLFAAIHGSRDETAIISMSVQVAAVLPAMLVVAAVMSQFSAVVADTAGGGGLFSELS